MYAAQCLDAPRKLVGVNEGLRNAQRYKAGPGSREHAVLVEAVIMLPLHVLAFVVLWASMQLRRSEGSVLQSLV